MRASRRWIALLGASLTLGVVAACIGALKPDENGKVDGSSQLQLPRLPD
jgi:hypothetical protein